jgi:hypothetical protein
MVTRDELKALIDQLPEPRLEMVRQMLDHHVHPQPPRPEMEQMRRRVHEYRTQVEQRFRETRKPGTLGAMGGGGSMGLHEGTPFGRQSFSYWDDKALVYQSLQNFDRQEIEVMERLSFSPDRTTLICALEISSGGSTVRHEDGFPVSPVNG